MDDLMSAISEVKNKRHTLRSIARNTEDFVRQLGLDLGVSPALAGQTFMLQSDAKFNSFLSEMDDSAAKYAEYSSRWGENHPKVQAQKSRNDMAMSSLKYRSIELVGANASDAIQLTNLQSSPERAGLFSKLIDNYATLHGIEAELVELQLSEKTMLDRLKIYTREVAELERLQRDHDLAEAVYTSAAAKLDAGRADIFASYPAVQMLSLPSLANKPRNPNKKIAVAMAVLGIIFVTFGVLAIWHRRYIVGLILKTD